MKVLLIGSGGREDALAWALRRSPRFGLLRCAPGNAGMLRRGECVDIGAEDVDCLVDHARRKRAAKRGGEAQRITLGGLTSPAGTEVQIDLLDLEEALAKLGELYPRKARIVELRFLAGLEESEIAHVLGVSTRTIEREWRLARAFLKCELSGDSVSL